ncbi:hypothetical protein J2858_001342 [Neorhizobium galegae]|uniref:hypothetical protein n=1 Tax=Rhizobium/Agrobacterium group TaxID=227290 RepID=UPI001AE5988F|nr:hypothetical protein [Neorhizobium galegae]MBP2548449.1 hypothetical protein [Neorhizobium galegae]
MTSRDIVSAYAAPAGLAVFVGLLCRLEGAPPAMTFHKILIALLLPMAWRGLRGFFPPEKDATRSWPAEVEFQLLSACVTGAFFVLIATPEMGHNVVRQILMFALFVLIALPLQLFFSWRKRRS